MSNIEFTDHKMESLKIPELVPSAAEDSQQLRKAFVGWGTEACIIKILGHRNAAQRKRVVHLWTMAPAERDA
ncbi:hypothetical protein RDI58_013842 [Solanum bulbocastanum]|uniref:Uncharacterized protein n=1 Tax=Solanum bulbocastanum TaxID=147425 RepID=A0AAN8TRN2_SOLBU